MDIDVNENEDQLRFVPSASISFAGPRESGFKCDGRCQREGFKCWYIAAETAEASGELDTCARVATNRMRVEKTEPMMNQRQWRRLVGKNRSRGNLAVGSGCLGLDLNQDHGDLRGQEDVPNN